MRPQPRQEDGSAPPSNARSAFRDGCARSRPGRTDFGRPNNAPLATEHERGDSERRLRALDPAREARGGGDRVTERPDRVLYATRPAVTSWSPAPDSRTAPR